MRSRAVSRSHSKAVLRTPLVTVLFKHVLLLLVQKLFLAYMCCDVIGYCWTALDMNIHQHS